MSPKVVGDRGNKECSLELLENSIASRNKKDFSIFESSLDFYKINEKR